MVIQMFNFWYFFWLLLLSALTVGLYFLLRGRSAGVQKGVLFGLLVLGLALHFLKALIPPYSGDEERLLRDIWFINICGANIALFPFLFFSKSKRVWDYMFAIGVISGLLAILYPIEPIEKADQLAETLDIIRFYYHHWMLLAVPLLYVAFGHHKLSYKRVLSAPTGLLLLMLFVMLNQIFQSELGFIPPRSEEGFLAIGYKNTSYIWGPGENEGIGKFLASLCPRIFKTVPVGPYAGEEKYWPWFWLIVPAYILVSAVTFLITLPFDIKSLKADIKRLPETFKSIMSKLSTK